MIGFVLTLPFILLEILNRGLTSNFPLPLFGFLWLLPTIFTATLLPIVRYLRAGGGLLDHPLGLFSRLLVLFLIAALWMGVLADQIPCFLGIPNCD